MRRARHANLHTPPAPRGDQEAGLPFDGEVWHDVDVARFLGVSVRTVTRRLEKPVSGEVDLNKAEPKRFGERRYWLRANVLRLLGIDEDRRARR